MEAFYSWLKEEPGFKLNECVQLRKSELDDPNSGYGIYVSVKGNVSNGSLDGAELLRIPPYSAFNIHSILKIINDSSYYATPENCELTRTKVKEIFGKFTQDDELTTTISETTILIFYFMLFMYIEGQYEIPTILRRYLHEVLLKTYIKNSITEHKTFLQFYGNYPTVITLESNFQAFKRFFSKLHLGTPEADIPSEEQLRQVYAAIISRVLEIPHEVSPDSQDYTTSTTLVPILDFVNHATGSDANAAFDIDRSTGDILLRLEGEPHIGHKERAKEEEEEDKFEVFIQYATTIEVISFYITYGFIPVPPRQPTNVNHTFFNISIDRNYISARQPERRLFYKWLNVVPAIQLCYVDESVGWVINDVATNWEELLLPDMTNDNGGGFTHWTYDKYAYETLVQFHCKLEKIDRDDGTSLTNLRAMYRNAVLTQERNGTDFIEFPQVAWSLSFTKGSGKQVRKRVTKGEALAVLRDLPQQERIQAQNSFLGFLREYLKWRVQELSYSQDEQNSEQELYVFESHVLGLLLDKLLQFETVTGSTKLFLGEITSQVNTVPLLPPILRGLEPDTEVAIPDITESELQGLEDYDPSEYTDFLQEEFDSFVTALTS